MSASVPVLDSVVASLREAFEGDLVSVVLFGSAAEGNARPLSDLNVLVVLRRFDRTRADGVRDALRTAQASVQLSAMFLVEDELLRAAEAFAVKFADLERRHRVLYGTDVLAGLVVTRESQIRRLRQVVLNLKLRMRWLYIVRSLREEQAARVAVEMAGPVRVAAASVYALEGKRVEGPRAALEQFVAERASPGWAQALADLRRARGGELLPPGCAPALLTALLEMIEALEDRALRLAP